MTAPSYESTTPETMHTITAMPNTPGPITRTAWALALTLVALAGVDVWGTRTAMNSGTCD